MKPTEPEQPDLQEKLQTSAAVTMFVLSDSAGETASKLAQATMAQYPSVEFNLFRRTFIHKEHLIKALSDAKTQRHYSSYLDQRRTCGFDESFCEEADLYHFDVLTPPVSEVERRTGVAPSREPGALHHLNENYFKRIKAMEFAVMYDDGKTLVAS